MYNFFNAISLCGKGVRKVVFVCGSIVITFIQLVISLISCGKVISYTQNKPASFLFVLHNKITQNNTLKYYLSTLSTAPIITNTEGI